MGQGHGAGIADRSPGPVPMRMGGGGPRGKTEYRRPRAWDEGGTVDDKEEVTYKDRTGEQKEAG